MEGGANTRGGRAFAWVLFTEFAEGDFWIGGRTDSEFVSPPGRFLVHVTIPEGYMNIAHKNEVHAWVTSAITQTLGSSEPGNSTLVVIDEVTEGNWGNAGHPIRHGGPIERGSANDVVALLLPGESARDVRGRISR
jgi:phenylpyruvate tautomerase PptA (4-oxalocrotonate tautomerase family)